MELVSKIDNWFLQPIGKIFAYLGGACVALMMFVVAIDVILRYGLSMPISFSVELTQILLLIVVYLGIGCCGLNKSHVAIDVIVSRFSKEVQAVISLIGGLISFCLLTAFIWQTILQSKIFSKFSQTTSGLHIPFSVLLFVVAVGCSYLWFILLRDFISSLNKALLIKSKYIKLWLVVGCIISLLFVLSPIIASQLGIKPDANTLVVCSIFFLLFLLFFNIPVAYAMAIVGVLGVSWMVSTDTGLGLLRTVPYRTGMFYDMSVIPLFILMGEICGKSGLVADLYGAVYTWIGFVPGGLGVATIGASTGFAAVSGSSVASAGAMSKICYPEMKRYNYDRGFAMGCVAVGGTLGTIIPPSMDFIIYGILTGTSIGELFVAGIIPGLLIASGYVLVTILVCKFNPNCGPRGPKTTWKMKRHAFTKIWGVVLLFLLVIGGIYLGIFTPLEGAGMGAFGSLLFAIARKKMTLKGFVESLKSTVEMSAMIMFILTGAFILSYFLTMTQTPFKLADFLGSLPVPPMAIIGAIMIMYLLLGCVMDVFSAVIVTIPVIFPVVMQLGFDPIWYGVLMIIVCEMGLISPPVGLNLFIVSAMDKTVPMSAIYRGVLPFIAIELVILALIIIFPQISTFLPSLM
ncbi:TRAP transporter large permease [Desulfocicer niacini]